MKKFLFTLAALLMAGSAFAVQSNSSDTTDRDREKILKQPCENSYYYKDACNGEKRELKDKICDVLESKTGKDLCNGSSSSNSKDNSNSSSSNGSSSAPAPADKQEKCQSTSCQQIDKIKNQAPKKD